MLEEQSKSVLENVDIKEEFKTERQGKPFVLYAGLIDAFHRKYHGCSREIDTTLEKIEFDDKGEPRYAVVGASVVANDGAYEYRFAGIGDATRSNVGKLIVPHLIRMAETRAKARALRDAVNVSVAAVEELGDSEGEHDITPAMPSRRDVLIDGLREEARKKGFTDQQIEKAVQRRWGDYTDEELAQTLDEMRNAPDV